jgi:formate dehydrogenase subunit delta
MTGVPAEQRMVNDIARQFRHLPPAEAADAVASHVRRFWDPRMRARLLELAEHDGDGLDPLAIEAAAKLRG